MPKATASSQWEFPELFSDKPIRVVLTVGGLTAKIRNLLESEIGTVWVTGEVTNCRAQSSGHLYFTIKDELAQLSCVLFRAEPVEHRSLIKDGTRVTLQGEMTLYEPRGQYQLRVTAVELEGTGALQVAFEKLKARLQSEGLFAIERKRNIPRFSRRIGLVTSRTGAAIRDVLHVIERRNPSLEIVLAACAVQGKAAGFDISNSIRMLNEWSKKVPPLQKLDLILITRGGGSLEDLWAFNEEIVARAIYGSELPIISAVGHEIDFTISDFVADLRAATPSAAAELITEGVFSNCKFVSQVEQKLRVIVLQQVDRHKKSHLTLKNRLERSHPRRKLETRMQAVDELHNSTKRCVRQGLRDKTKAQQELAARLKRFRPRVIHSQYIDNLKVSVRALHKAVANNLSARKERLMRAQSRLVLLSPEHVLSRGYSITTDVLTGQVLTTANKVKAGQLVNTRLKNGQFKSKVETAPPKAS